VAGVCHRADKASRADEVCIGRSGFCDGVRIVGGVVFVGGCFGGVGLGWGCGWGVVVAVGYESVPVVLVGHLGFVFCVLGWPDQCWFFVRRVVYLCSYSWVSLATWDLEGVMAVGWVLVWV